MERRRTRLGDVIDDYCTRCGLLMNHGVVGMVGDEVRKVRCNTCMSEHVYKHARLPKRKREANAKLFNEVLRGLGREPGEATPEASGAPASGSAAGARPAAHDADGDGPMERDAEGAERSAAPETAGDDSTGDSGAPAPPAEPERPPEREGFEAHRRKLFTIRRHSGGKPPSTGKPPGTGRPHR